MKVMEIRIGNSVVEIYDDYVNPDKTEEILKKLGTIGNSKRKVVEKNVERDTA